MPISEVQCSATNPVRAPECHLDTDVDQSLIPRVDNLIPSTTSGIDSEKFPGKISKGASPFRLLQDYASDDSTETGDAPSTEDVSPVTVSPSVTTDTSLHRDIEYNLESGVGTKGSSRAERSSEPFSAPELAMDVKNVVKTSITTRTTDQHVVIHEKQAPISHGASVRAGHEKSGGVGVHIVPESRKAQEEITPLKIDEFGRLVKEGGSDSGSDDSHYIRKRGKRGRSRSHSRSPGRRRRRRSPLRRKERRSRSHRYAWNFMYILDLYRDDFSFW